MADYYVDFSATYDGDGSTYTQAAGAGQPGAYNTIFGKSFSTGDKVWVRRKQKTVTTAQTLSYTGVIFIGWPQSGDVYYSSRPEAPQATWDDDADSYAELYTTTAITLLQVTGNSQELHRFKVRQNTATANQIALSLTMNTFKSYNCYFRSDVGYGVSLASGTTNSLTQFYSAKIEGSVAFNCSGGTTGQATVLQDCSLEALPVSGTTYACFINQAATTATLIGCTLKVNSASGVGFYAGSILGLAVSNCQLDCNAATTGDVFNVVSTTCTGFVQNVSITGGRRILLAGKGTFHFAQFAPSGASNGYQIDANNLQGVLTLQNVAFSNGNTTGDLRLSAGLLGILQNVTFAHPTKQLELNGGLCLIGDDGGSLGAWRIEGGRGKAQTSSVYRTNGESFSLRLAELATMNVPVYGHLIGIPGLETTWVSLASGANTITVYGAYKGFASDPPTQADIWIETDYLDQESGARRDVAASRAIGTLTSDDSTWNNDDSLTPFKLTLSVTAGQACLAPIRLVSTKVVASAYIYIDPKPVVS